MQGTRAATEVIDALARLDRDPAVDVIVVARGGGSVEDLLPFSDEALVRAVAGTRTPVVSAIGHEPDTPLLDLVADVRASTPTDAAKHLVPDVVEEAKGVAWARDRVRSLVRQLVERESRALADLRARPALADPRSLLDAREVEVTDLRDRGRRVLDHRLARALDDVTHQRARARALSPLETLRRGYAVVQRADAAVLASVSGAHPGDPLTIRVADGRVLATTTGVEPDPALTEEDHDG
jgi:exodeoxyribonuclease VII large subunit